MYQFWYSDMSIRRRKSYTDNFTIIDRRALEDKRLSWRARGLLAYLMSKPDHWDVSVVHLVKQGDVSKDTVYSMLKELIKHGYAEQSRERKADGTLGATEYVITDFPPNPVLPEQVEPVLVNPTQVSTDIKQVLKVSNNAADAAEKKSRGSRECPEDFIPSEKTAAKVREHHPHLTSADLDEGLRQMKRYVFAKARKDWNATYRNWMNNYRPQRGGKSNLEQNAAVMAEWLEDSNAANG